MNNIQWKTYLILLATLGLGIIIGAFSTHYCHKSGVGGFYKCRSHGGSYSMGKACPPGDCKGKEKCEFHGGKEGKGFHGKHGYSHPKPYGHHSMGEMNAEQLLKKMEAHLDLTQEQKEKVEPILEQFAIHLRDNFDQHKKSLMALMDEIEPSLAPILSEEQMNKLKKKMDRKRKFFQGPHRGPGREQE